MCILTTNDLQKTPTEETDTGKNVTNRHKDRDRRTDRLAHQVDLTLLLNVKLMLFVSQSGNGSGC